MFAELVPIDLTLESKEKPTGFALNNKFTGNHQINSVVEDKQRQCVIFITESYHLDNIATNNNLIDSVALFKIVLGADDKISFQQMAISLHDKQVNAKVICT